jgi:hypothetical protein
MAIITCPKCGTNTERAGFHGCIWLVAILLFPFGLLAFLMGRKPTICHNCHNAFTT